MQIETFECLEEGCEVGTPEEQSQEALELIRKMGLEGQSSLVKTREDGTKERLPYREMTQDEIFAYGVLCPKAETLKRYSASSIPLRVLQVASHAKELFEEVYVWSAASAQVKDPILVGKKKGGDVPFILARWGEELDSLPNLMKKAMQIYKMRFEEAVNRCKQQLASLTPGGVEAAHFDRWGCRVELRFPELRSW